MEPGLFLKINGLTVHDFELLVSIGVFNSALMNDAVVMIWSIISSAFGSSDLGALRRYKSLMWLGHTARFAPGIASQL